LRSATGRQLSLLDENGAAATAGHPAVATDRALPATLASTNPPPLTVSGLLPSYGSYLKASAKSPHTVKNFMGDIRRLGAFPGERPLLSIQKQDLRQFIATYEKGGGAPKTITRKVAALRNFFRWLKGDGIVLTDPARGLVFPRAIPPLPEVLTGEETARLIEASRERPLENVLVLLLLGAGLKMSEVGALTRDRIDISDPLKPTARIKAKEHFKERNAALPLDFVEVYQVFMEQSRPSDRLFDCTERNFNYILRSIAVRAGISKTVSCKVLRDTFAVQCVKAGERIDDVLRKLGLTPTRANEETRQKYRRLAELTPE
jgi:site-specific recombinase XerD